MVDKTGDLLDTSYFPLRCLIQDSRTRLEGDIGDWEIYPTLGANLSDFIGQPNDSMTGSMIENRTIQSLSQDAFVARSDIQTRYVPVSIYAATCIIKINVSRTPGLDQHLEWLQLEYAYDSASKGLIHTLGG